MSTSEERLAGGHKKRSRPHDLQKMLGAGADPRYTLTDKVVANRIVKALPTLLELCALMGMEGKC